MPSVIGGDLRHHRVGAGAEVLRADLHQRGAVGADTHARGRRHAMRRIGAGRHAPADQHIAVAHGTRFVRATRPAERLGPLADSIRAAPCWRTACSRADPVRRSCAAGTPADPCFSATASSSIADSSAKLPLGEAGRPHIRRQATHCVATSRCVTATFGQAYSISVASPTGSAEFAKRRLRHLREAVMPHRHQMALFVRREAQLLHGARAIAVGGEHLRPRHRELHRLADHLRRHRGERRRRPGVALAAKAAADIGTDHVHIGLLDAEQRGQRLLRAGNALRRCPDGQPVAIPARDRRVRLHRIVMFDRRDVGGIDLHRRLRRTPQSGSPRRESGGRVAIAEILRRIGLAEHRIHRRDRLVAPIAHAHQRGGGIGLLQASPPRRPRHAVR